MVQEWQDTIEVNENILPITSLSHITHNKQEKLIGGYGGIFVFKPKTKFGKALVKYDGTPVGETFEATGQSTFRHIPYRSPVL